MKRISLDIETAPLPWAEGEEPVFEPVFFDPEAVKVGNLKDHEKIQAKLAAAEAAWQTEQAARAEAFIGEVEEARRKRALSWQTGQITCICMCNDEIGLYASYLQPDLNSEKDILEFFWTVWADFAQIITYGGYSFDMQFIIMRSLHHGIPCPALRARGNKYPRHIDTDRHLDLINLYDVGGKWSSLDNVCKAILGESKTGDGAGAIDLYESGQYEELSNYCMQDAKLTWSLWKKIGGE